MDFESKLREDLWKAIQAHYERADYTEAVRDAMFHICELLREKSGFADKDGTKLVEATLMGANPAILINKYETTTEKDMQQGIGFALKGLMQAVRNPMSHEKTMYVQDEAEAIIIYANYLLNKIDQSGGVTKIDDVMGLLHDEDFTDTKEYAQLLLKEVPIKKRYDLLLQLYNEKASLPQHKLHFFIDELLSSLSKTAKASFCNAVSKSLLKCKDDMNLRMYCHYFMENTYVCLDRLAQLRLEDLMLKSIKNGQEKEVFDEKTGKSETWCIEGSLGTWISDKLELMSNKKEIIATLFLNAEKGAEYEEYVFNNFSDVLFNNSDYEEWEIALVNRRLKKGDEHFYNALWEDILLFQDEELTKLFGEAFAECSRIIDSRDKADFGTIEVQTNLK